MSVSKDKARGTYYVQCRYRDWQGKQCKKTKRGFTSERAARKWEHEFLLRIEGAPTMTFADFYRVYREDVSPRLRRSTWNTKAAMIETKILPYFEAKPINEIASTDVIAWENELMELRTSNGLPLSPTYLHSICNQFSAIMSHAVKHYGLASNPMHKVGKIGEKNAEEMHFWTKDEYLRFSRELRDKPASHMAFEILYWCGLRVGELLALTPRDFDFARRTVSVTKSYQRIGREDVITAPKTKKSVRTIVMPEFLAEETRDYLACLRGIAEDERIFRHTKSFLREEMRRGCKACGMEPIRIHDLRHSHVSLLIELGYSALAIADRMGHESTEVTMRYAHLFPNKQQEMAADLDIQRAASAGYNPMRALKEAKDDE